MKSRSLFQTWYQINFYFLVDNHFLTFHHASFLFIVPANDEYLAVDQTCGKMRSFCEHLSNKWKFSISCLFSVLILYNSVAFCFSFSKDKETIKVRIVNRLRSSNPIVIFFWIRFSQKLRLDSIILIWISLHYFVLLKFVSFLQKQMWSLNGLFFWVLFGRRKDWFEVNLKTDDKFHDIVIVESLFESFDLFFENFFHVRFVVLALMIPVLKVDKIFFEIGMKAIVFLKLVLLVFEKIEGLF